LLRKFLFLCKVEPDPAIIMTQAIIKRTLMLENFFKT
jgi:hypothetical protein